MISNTFIICIAPACSLHSAFLEQHEFGEMKQPSKLQHIKTQKHIPDPVLHSHFTPGPSQALDS